MSWLIFREIFENKESVNKSELQAQHQKILVEKSEEYFDNGINVFRNSSGAIFAYTSIICYTSI